MKKQSISKIASMIVLASLCIQITASEQLSFAERMTAKGKQAYATAAQQTKQATQAAIARGREWLTSEERKQQLEQLAEKGKQAYDTAAQKTKQATQAAMARGRQAVERGREWLTSEERKQQLEQLAAKGRQAYEATIAKAKQTAQAAITLGRQTIEKGKKLLTKEEAIKQINRELTIIKTGINAAEKKIRGQALTANEKKALSLLAKHAGILAALIAVVTGVAVGTSLVIRKRGEMLPPQPSEKGPPISMGETYEVLPPMPTREATEPTLSPEEAAEQMEAALQVPPPPTLLLEELQAGTTAQRMPTTLLKQIRRGAELKHVEPTRKTTAPPTSPVEELQAIFRGGGIQLRRVQQAPKPRKKEEIGVFADPKVQEMLRRARSAPMPAATEVEEGWGEG